MTSVRFLQSVFAIMLTAGLVSAAVIKGTVTDTLTKSPAESVLVTVKNTAIHALTNAQGNFSLTIATGINRPEQDRATRATTTWAALTNAPVEVFGTDGARLLSARAGTPEALLSNVPDGIYVLTAQWQGRAYTAKAIRLNGVCRPGAFTESAAKAGAAVTLVCTHKYYNTKEASANEGDTSVIAKLRMWFPSPATTGPTDTTGMTSITSRTISTNGTILENVRINGTITIRAHNVTVRNFICTTGDYFSFDASGTNILIEDGECNGGNTCDEAFRGQGYTAQRLYIHNYEGDAFKAGSNCVIEGCYITKIGQGSGAHGDGMQSMGGTGIDIIHNNFNLTDGSLTACIFPGGGTTVYDILLDRNRFNGGGWVVYSNEYTTAVNNVFGPLYGYGPRTGSYAVWTGNVWEATGLPAQ
jgi:hypothetical protein